MPLYPAYKAGLARHIPVKLRSKSLGHHYSKLIFVETGFKPVSVLVVITLMFYFSMAFSFNQAMAGLYER